MSIGHTRSHPISYEGMTQYVVYIMKTDGPMFWESLAKKRADLKKFSQKVLVLQLIYFSGFDENRSSSFLSIHIHTNRYFERKTKKFVADNIQKRIFPLKSLLLFLPYFLYNIVCENES